MAAAPPQKSISPSSMPLISPSALLQAYLTQSPPKRPSNRTTLQTRQIHLNVSSLTHCNGSALVKIGESTVVCGIRAEILPVSEIPYYRASESARSSEGSGEVVDEDEREDYNAIKLNNLLVPNLELGTNCHSAFPPNVAPSVTAQSMSQRVLSLLHSSQLVRVTDLEIRHSSDPAISVNLDPDDPAYIEPEKNALKAYWTLYIDCVCLSYGGEGNLFDTVVLAVVAALSDVQLPKTRWDQDMKQVLCSTDPAKAKSLSLRGLPCSMSFAVASLDSRIRHDGAVSLNGTSSPGLAKHRVLTILDTDAFEDMVCEEKGNIVVDCSSGRCKILRIEKIGGQGLLDTKAVEDVLREAEFRWKAWKEVLRSFANDGG